MIKSRQGFAIKWFFLQQQEQQQLQQQQQQQQRGRLQQLQQQKPESSKNSLDRVSRIIKKDITTLLEGKFFFGIFVEKNLILKWF
jgi:hypothetical protein